MLVFNGLATLGVVFSAKLAHDFVYADWDAIQAQLKKDMFSLLRHTPILGRIINAKIDRELLPMLKHIEEDVRAQRGEDQTFNELPADGFSEEILLDELDKIKQTFNATQLYKVSGSVYCAQDDEADNLFRTKVAERSRYTNPLHPDIWPDLQKKAAQVVNTCFKMFNHDAPQKGYGYITPGGTYSIVEACKAYVNRYYERQNSLQKLGHYLFQAKPEIIVPSTAHAAFDKAAKILGCKLVKVPVDPLTQAADVRAMRNKINRNTILLVGSAPSYPTGTMDNIEALGRAAQDNNIGLHVDACLGGFVVPFLSQAGHTLPTRFGFDVPGVSSISVDTHKQGGADKGSSVVLYKCTESLGKYQMSTHMDWSGGIYATPGIGGSASGYCIASTWSELMRKGLSGYIQDAKHIRETVQAIDQTFQDNPDIQCLGRADVNVIAFTSKTLNPHVIADQMKLKGWMLNVLPQGFHFCVTGVHGQHPDFIKSFCDDLKVSIAHVKAHPDVKPKGDGAIYGTTAALPSMMDSLKEGMARDYLAIQWRAITSEPKSTKETSSKSEPEDSSTRLTTKATV